MTRSDQAKINAFSRLYSKESTLEAEVQAATKAKEDLEEISTELELVDEDEKVMYKLGDSFVALKQEKVLKLVEEDVRRAEVEVEKAEERLRKAREEMEGLKAELYERFGGRINLEA